MLNARIVTHSLKARKNKGDPDSIPVTFHSLPAPPDAKASDENRINPLPQRQLGDSFPVKRNNPKPPTGERRPGFRIDSLGVAQGERFAA